MVQINKLWLIVVKSSINNIVGVYFEKYFAESFGNCTYDKNGTNFGCDMQCPMDTSCHVVCKPDNQCRYPKSVLSQAGMIKLISYIQGCHT